MYSTLDMSQAVAANNQVINTILGKDIGYKAPSARERDMEKLQWNKMTRNQSQSPVIHNPTITDLVSMVRQGA